MVLRNVIGMRHIATYAIMAIFAAVAFGVYKVSWSFGIGVCLVLYIFGDVMYRMFIVLDEIHRLADQNHRLLKKLGKEHESNDTLNI